MTKRSEAAAGHNAPSSAAPMSAETGCAATSAVAIPAAEAWAAVAARDRRYDGVFVYAVATTGIYCRPSCPARRPHRANALFFPATEAAERAGYRACRRCRPDHAAGTPAEQTVDRVRRYLEAHLDEAVTLDALADAVGYSPSHLQRTFKQVVGLSPKAYQDTLRLEAFKEQVREGGTVLEATYEAGFGSSRSLYEQAEAGLGMTPGTYRRGGEGLHIRFTTVASALGRVLVAATARGVCAVALGEDDVQLVAELAEEFSAAVLERDDAGLRPWAEPVVRYLEGTCRHPAVPVDLHGTDFQRRVWRVLQDIPPGETRSYGDVAAALGHPSAARAVAQACARNKVALVVPCHRVVRASGEPGGYRWGIARKRHLLEMERGG